MDITPIRQCGKDDNYCGSCNRVISDCRCSSHHEHSSYPRASDNDDYRNCNNNDNCNTF